MKAGPRGLDDASREWQGEHEEDEEHEEHEEQEGRFLVAVGAMIEHAQTRRVLLMKRSEHVTFLPGVWEDIGGRLKQFEEPEDALRREVWEETGLEIEIIRPIS